MFMVSVNGLTDIQIASLARPTSGLVGRVRVRLASGFALSELPPSLTISA